MKKTSFALLFALVSGCATAPERVEVIALTGGTVAQRLDSGTLVLQITEE
jgi:hypothetical protein